MMRTHTFRNDGPVGRGIGLVLFLLAIGYVAEILSVATHEIVGHGLSAVLLGGTFSGFVLRWDGMGWAFCDLPSSVTLVHHVLHLASGVVAEISCGLMFLVLTLLLRKRPDIQLVLLVISSICLVDGSSYVLWNAYHPVAPGDIGQIIWLSCGPQLPEVSVIRWTLLVIGAILFAGTTFCLYTAVFVRIEALIVRGGQLTGGPRLLVLFAFLVLPNSVGWFVFDWDQLAPGIGRLPGVVGALSVAAMAGLLFWYRPRFKVRDSDHPISWRHIAIAWTCLIVTVLAVALWFNNGVWWASKGQTYTPRITGPFAFSASGEFLFCGLEQDRTHHCRVIIALRGEYRGPAVLSFPGSDKCLGVTWRPGVNPDELLFVTAGEGQAIKRLRVSNVGVEEISSYPVDPNLLVTARSGWWSPSGNILALRVTTFEGGVFSGSYVGFSKDNGKTVRISALPAPGQLLWVADNALYVTHFVDADEVALSKADLNADNMTVATREVLQDKIILATQSLHGSLVYAKGDRLFRDDKIFAVLPEKIVGPLIDGDCLAVVSADGKRVYILDDTGKIIDAKEMPERAICIGISAVNKSIYWTSYSPEDRTKISAYNFVGKRETLVIEANAVCP
jgi:hypothetical protein